MLENKTVEMANQAISFKRSYCTDTYPIFEQKKSTRYEIQSAGYTRSYYVQTPKNYDPSVRYPVIVNFDGIDGGGEQMKSYAGTDALPVIAVYPDSLMGTQGFTAWQGAPYSLEGDYDIQFVRDMLDELPANYCVDSTKTFGVGMSNGGGFVALAGCHLPDRFKAVVSVSGAFYESCAGEPKSVSFLVVHGSADKQVPLEGSKSRGLPEVSTWVHDEAARRSCGENVKMTAAETATQYDWDSCADNTLLRLVIMKEQGHGWLDLPQVKTETGAATANYIWRFFEEATYRG